MPVNKGTIIFLPVGGHLSVIAGHQFFLALPFYTQQKILAPSWPMQKKLPPLLVRRKNFAPPLELEIFFGPPL